MGKSLAVHHTVVCVVLLSHSVSNTQRQTVSDRGLSSYCSFQLHISIPAMLISLGIK